MTKALTLTLDERISTALAEPIALNDITNLIGDVEVALAAAEEDAAATKKAALDPLEYRYQDANAAHGAIDVANFAVERLRTAQSRLAQRYGEVEAREALDQWTAEAARVEKRRDAAAAKFTQCRGLIEQLAAAFAEVQEVEEECSAVNRASPPGQRHIQGPEQTARRLAAFSSSDPSVIKETVLFWSGKQIWPPRKPSLAAAMFAPLPLHDQRFSDDWHAAGADAQKQSSPIAREQQRIEAWHKEEARLQAERIRQEDFENRAAKRRTA